MKIYILMFSIGEYSDRSEYIYKAYDDEIQAKNALINLDSKVRMLINKYDDIFSLELNKELDELFGIEVTACLMNNYNSFIKETELINHNKEEMK